MPKRLPLTLLVGLLPGSMVCADGLERDTVPFTWMASDLPEALPEVERRAYDAPIDLAAKQVFQGRYRQALITLHSVEDGDPARKALIRAMALEPLGREAEALATLDDPAVAALPEAQVLKARILSGLGRHREALSALEAHLQQHPTSIAGRYHLGAVHEALGNFDQAALAYQWFVDERFLERWTADNEPRMEQAADAVYVGRALDRWALLTQAYRQDRGLHNAILRIFVRAYDVLDRVYWPAHVAAAEYYLAHDDVGKAVEELQAALQINPHSVEALTLLGHITAAKRNFAVGTQTVATLRTINADSHIADLLDARLLLSQRQADEAEPPIRKALESRPDDPEALGLLAVCHALRLRDEEMQQTLARVDEVSPNNAGVYLDVAEYLRFMWQYDQAEKMYQRASEIAPWWAAPQNGLGLLYAANGEEDKARVVLEQARAMDPFNVETTNYLRVLDIMAGFETLETEHFIFTYSAEDDPIVPKFMAPYMESIFDEVAADFQHKPNRKLLIQVFPDIDSFSVRTAGMPGAKTYGASFGPVVTAVAPRRGHTMGPYDFSRVLRHEFTHAMNMSATDHRCPRWLTEGLAVWQEKVPYRFTWVPPVLYKMSRDGELFPISKLESVFLNPQEATDGEIAYMQGFWTTLYLQEKHGPDAHVRLLDAYRRGLSNEEAFREVTGEGTAAFDRSFGQWARQRVAEWGYDEETTQKVDALIKEGNDLIKSRQLEQAVEVWKQIAELRPVDLLPQQRLAGLYLAMKRPLDAIEHLKRVHDVSLKDNRYAIQMARLYRDGGEMDQAIDMATEAIYINPYDLKAHQLLAELYDKAGRADAAAEQKQIVAQLQKKGEAK